MKHLILTYSIVTLAVLFFTSCDINDSPLDSKKALIVYMPDGTRAAANVTVSVYQSDDTTHIPLYTTTTDEDGTYSIGDNLANDSYYNITLQSDTLSAFQDSILITDDSISAHNDTLFLSRNISGKVKLQENHNLQTVTIHVLGTFNKSGVSQEGVFTLQNLAVGLYTVMCVSTIDEYTPLYYQLQVSPSTSDTINDELELIYTGIPIVQGLEITSDTAKGTATLSWNKTDYFDHQDYRIYRTDLNSTTWPETPLYVTTDTSIVDTIYTNPSDTNSYAYKYRITLSNNSDIEGRPYGSVSVTTIAPQIALSFIAVDTLLVDSESITLTTAPTSWYGTTPVISWDFGNNGTFTPTSGFDTTVIFPTDELLLNYPVVIKATGDSSRVILDTVYLRTNKSMQIQPQTLPFSSGLSAGIFEFNGSLIMPHRREGVVSLLESHDAINWEIKKDSVIVGNVYIYDSFLWNNRLCLLIGKKTYADHWLKWVTIDTNYTVTEIATLPQAVQDEYFNYAYTSTHIEGNQLELHSRYGDWLFDTDFSLIGPTSALTSPLSYYSSYSTVMIQDQQYAVCSGTIESHPHIFKKESDTEDTKILEFQNLGTSTRATGYSPAFSYKDGAILMVQGMGFEMSKKIIYSTDMINWTIIGDMPETIVYSIYKYNGKIILYCSGGTIYTFE